MGALMAATGYSLDQYYVLGRNDYNAGNPQSQALDQAIFNAQQQSGKDFLAFQGKLALNGIVAGLTGGIGNVAVEATAGTRVGSMLEYMLTTRTGTAATGAVVNTGAQMMRNDGHVNFVEVGTAAAAAYLGLGRGFWLNTALGGGASVVNTEYGNLADGKDDNVWLSAGTGALTTGVGYQFGHFTTKWLSNEGSGALGPVITGNVSGSLMKKVAGAVVQKSDDDDSKDNKERQIEYHRSGGKK